ncbi:hypothetical protein VFPFJ_07399 [Purpureocillium lilacinum]|uniref:Uncharacterized protein n=1 Tax=Purpureocillium lilacinum TaxID=33203 RepID=A0A179HFZ6_PURLI|nr:hypothetical protein VFPFJ_07399 [Purpureocillium lilacinum]OAQ88934.1 hypothetical protein VFPFJ_07399 [Purpureocillium lilacinum]
MLALQQAQVRFSSATLAPPWGLCSVDLPSVLLAPAPAPARSGRRATGGRGALARVDHRRRGVHRPRRSNHSPACLSKLSGLFEPGALPPPLITVVLTPHWSGWSRARDDTTTRSSPCLARPWWRCPSPLRWVACLSAACFLWPVMLSSPKLVGRR